MTWRHLGAWWTIGWVAAGCGASHGASPDLDERGEHHAHAMERGSWIRTEPVSDTSVPTRIDAPGRVVVLHDVDTRLSVPTSGRVRTVHVREGVRVEEGAPLVTLDSGDAARQRAELTALKVEWRAAQAELERQERLAAHGVGLEVERLRAEAGVHRARAAYDAAASAAALLGDGQGGTLTLRAPMAGVVVEVRARPGLAVSPDSGPLVAVAHTDALHVRLEVYEDGLRRVAIGQPVSVSSADGSATAAGTVIEVADAADPETRRGPVLVALDAVPAGWVAGRMVRGRVDAAPSASLAVPVSAVVIRPDRTRVVYVEGDDGAYTQRPVEVGRVVDGRVPVMGGLALGDRVVVEGALLVDAMADRML